MEYPAREFDKYLYERIEQLEAVSRGLFRAGAWEAAQVEHQKASELRDARNKFFKLFKQSLI
jgi:hypothetical protein